MKYGLIIQDLDKDQVTQIIGKLSPLNITSISDAPAAPEVPAVTNVAAVPPAPTEAPAAAEVEVEKPKVAPKIVAGEGVDADGMIWDARIHAKTKTKTAKGVWKRLRGIEDAFFDEVVAELKTSADNEAPAAPTAPVAPPAATIPPPPAAAAAPVAPIARDYAGLMTQIQQDFTAGIVDAEYPNTIVARINEGFKTDVPTIVDISGNPQMVDYAWQCVDVDTQARAA